MRLSEKLGEKVEARNERVASHALIDIDSEGNVVKIITSMEEIEVGSTSPEAEKVRVWWEKLQYRAQTEPTTVAPILLAAISRGQPMTLLVDLASLPTYAL